MNTKQYPDFLKNIPIIAQYNTQEPFKVEGFSVVLYECSKKNEVHGIM